MNLDPLKEAARDAPNEWAVQTRELRLTFSELDAEASRYAAELERLKVGFGDRIAIHHPSDWRIVALLFAAWRIGASLCPLNLRLPPSGVDACLKRISPSLYLTSLSLPLNTSLTPQPHSGLPPSLLLFTSGSTAEPKIAILSRSNLLANAEGALPALDLRPNDRWLLSLPLFHVGGIGIALRCILARAAILWEIAGATHLSYVPTQLYRAWPVS